MEICPIYGGNLSYTYPQIPAVGADGLSSKVQKQTPKYFPQRQNGVNLQTWSLIQTPTSKAKLISGSNWSLILKLLLNNQITCAFDKVFGVVVKHLLKS